MYIKTLIDTIKNFDESDSKLFELYAFNFQKDYLKKEKLRYNDFKSQLSNFLNGDTVKISFDNLDSYLYALELLENRSKKTIASNSKVRWKINNWKDLLTETNFPLEFNLLHLDKTNTKIVQSIVNDILMVSAGASKEETEKRLTILNEFIYTFLKK